MIWKEVAVVVAYYKILYMFSAFFSIFTVLILRHTLHRIVSFYYVWCNCVQKVISHWLEDIASIIIGAPIIPSPNLTMGPTNFPIQFSPRLSPGVKVVGKWSWWHRGLRCLELYPQISIYFNSVTFNHGDGFICHLFLSYRKPKLNSVKWKNGNEWWFGRLWKPWPTLRKYAFQIGHLRNESLTFCR
jgi:hypothetical protein